MTEVHHVVESRTTPLPLTVTQAAVLRDLGRRLARGVSDEGEASLVECTTVDGSTWNVRVANAVGVVALPGAQVVVHPKIPLPHLLALLSRAGSLPRVDRSPSSLALAPHLWELVARWYVDALSSLLRSGLASSYHEHRAELATVRGRLVPGSTTMRLLQGRVSLDCEYDEFSVDTPLNRLLLAAARHVGQSALLSADVRRVARRSAAQMEGVGQLRRNDLHAEPERATGRYRVAVDFAKSVLAGVGVDLAAGGARGTVFLLPTPLAVEAGLRSIVQDALAGLMDVRAGRRALPGTSLTLNPDLQFGAMAVGDVKYKVWEGEWLRSDLYQLVAFATGFGVEHVLHLGFGAEAPAPLQVGGVRVHAVQWPVHEHLDAQQAEGVVRERLRAWWAEVTSVRADEHLDRPASLDGDASRAAVAGGS